MTGVQPRPTPGATTSRLPWRVVAAGSMIQLFVSSLLIQSYGAYVVLLRQEFGWSRTLLSAGYSLLRVEIGLLGPAQGWLLDRFGSRAVMRVGVLMLGGGFVLFSQVHSPYTFLAAVALMAVGASLTGWLSIVVAIVRNFDRQRTKAIAAAKIGIAVGGLLVPLVVLTMQTVGWRTTALASGVLVLLAGPVLTHFIGPHDRRPASPVEDGGGATGAGEQAEEAGQAEEAETSGFTAREAARTRAFWLISIGHSTASLVVASLNVHLIPHLTESLGYSLATAGLVVSLLTAMQGLGIIVSGWLGDRLRKRVMLMTCMTMHALGVLLVTYAVSPVMVVGFAVFHGLAWGTRAPLIQALRADYFGTRSFGSIAGWSAMLVMVGQTSGPIVAGALFDLTGSYLLPFTLMAAGATSGAVFFFLATPPASRQSTGGRA